MSFTGFDRNWVPLASPKRHRPADLHPPELEFWLIREPSFSCFDRELYRVYITDEIGKNKDNYGNWWKEENIWHSEFPLWVCLLLLSLQTNKQKIAVFSGVYFVFKEIKERGNPSSVVVLVQIEVQVLLLGCGVECFVSEIGHCLWLVCHCVPKSRALFGSSLSGVYF